MIVREDRKPRSPPVAQYGYAGPLPPGCSLVSASDPPNTRGERSATRYRSADETTTMKNKLDVVALMWLTFSLGVAVGAAVFALGGWLVIHTMAPPAKAPTGIHPTIWWT
jgi:hypothetical protein